MPFDKRSDGGKGAYPPRRSTPPSRPIPPSRESRSGDRPGYGTKSGYGDRPKFGERPRYGEKPRFEDRPRYGEKPRFEDKPRYGEKPRFEDKPRYESKPRFENKPRYESKPRFENKPRYEERPPRRMDERPPREYQPSPTHPLPPSEDYLRRDIVENLIAGRNPIREALKANQSFEKLLVSDGELTGSAKEILAMAREKGVVVQFVDKRRLDYIYPNHQGMIGYISAGEYSSVDDILAVAAEKGEAPLVVVLDGITDPHNFGAIARSAECMGAHGIIIPQRRSVGLTPSAVKASAGAFSYIKTARVVNVNRALEELKEKGLWVTGAVMDGTPADKCAFTGPLALVVGSEEDGLSQLVRKNCDQLATIPMTGNISSLNASVAASVLLYEIAKARRAG